ncbi:MAG: hypothetical protein QW767_06730 [Thermoprotei archaeon]
MSQKLSRAFHEVIYSGWTYVWIGLWFTIDGSRSADGFEAVLGVIMVLGGALELDRKAKKIQAELDKLRNTHTRPSSESSPKTDS